MNLPACHPDHHHGTVPALPMSQPIQRSRAYRRGHRPDSPRRRLPGSPPAGGNGLRRLLGVPRAASVSPARRRPRPRPGNAARRPAWRSLSAACGGSSSTAIPTAHVRLFFFDCVPADPAAEPAAGSGSRWVPAEQLASLRFPEANEPLLEELARAVNLVTGEQ